MYISLLRLNPRLDVVRRDLANPYEMHRTLSWAVASALEQGTERMLWRLEPVVRTELPTVLVQTVSCPDWNAILDRSPGYADIRPPKLFEPVLPRGGIFWFRLRANASVKQHGKRRAIKTPEGKVAWLRRRLEEGGCQLVGAVIREDRFYEASKGGVTLKVQATLFEGRLRVEHPASAAETLRRGVGSAKALGLGLLSLCRG
jgi:CRISPR system Cascade subunit CasE